MTDSKWTPGPWVASNAHTGPTFWRIEPLRTEYLNDGWVIASEVPGPDGEANAKLIASAPELYDAALRALEAMEGTDDVLHRSGMMEGIVNPAIEPLRAALAKAEGRSL